MIENNCLICQRINLIKQNQNPCFVIELRTGYVVFGDYQFFKGYTIFLCKQHVCELHDLQPEFKKQYLEEMTLVAEAVFTIFKPEKLNYELLGNTDRHLHWHIFPRYKSDPMPKQPIWNIQKTIRNNEQLNIFLQQDSEFEILKEDLKAQIIKLI